MSERPRPTWLTLLVDVAVVLAAFIVAGLLAGVLWPQVVDPVEVTRNELGTVTGEVALANRFDNEGWFSVLGGGFGLVLGLGLIVWRRGNEIVTLLAVVAGALLASWVAARLGHWLGPEDPREVLLDAEIGATAPGVVSVEAKAAYLVWPIAALIGALVALWRSAGDPREGQPDPRPDMVE